MFVTSDIFDLKNISDSKNFIRRRPFYWRENLLGGIDVHGRLWPGYEVAAQFLLEATKCCGFEDMHYAGYNVPGVWRTRAIKPKSFERLARGLLRGAQNAEGVLYKGEFPAEGVGRDSIVFGGSAGSIHQKKGYSGPVPLPGPPWRFQANFNFPLDNNWLQVAHNLFQLSIDILGAEYGYFFVRDDFCGPDCYMYGMATLLDGSFLARDDKQELGNWSDVVADGALWSPSGPSMRDLFQVNLLSDHHARQIVDGQYGLVGWIEHQPGRGAVQKLGQDRWLWTLTDAEMVAVRPVLAEAGFLFSCRDRVYRDLPNGGRP